MNKNSILKVLCLVLLLHGAEVSGIEEEELEVRLQFFEFDLEDICTAKADVQWDFLTGNKSDLQQLFNLELKEASLYRNERATFQDFFGQTFSNQRLQRLFDMFFKPGASQLGDVELKEYKEYSVKLQEIISKMTIGCPENDISLSSIGSNHDGKNKSQCIPMNANKVNKILATEKDEKKLKKIWTDWFMELKLQNQKTRFDFMEQLSILDIEAEQNEEDDLSDYWLKQSDVTDLDYHKISLLWKELIPLYQKLRKYMAAMMQTNYGSEIFIDKKLFPMHLLGTLNPKHWLVAAEKLGAFDHVKPYKVIKSKLAQKNMADVYKMADNFTSEVKLGDLPPEFYNNSNFNVSSPSCEDKTFAYCKSKNALRAIACADEDITITRFIKAHEDVMKLKHLIIAGKEEEENGFLFREGHRDSVIYEAISSLSSLISVRPKNLRKQHLLPESPLPNEEIVSLLISALHIIPSLPYYLAADLWRINALKELDATIGESTYEPSSTFVYSSTSTTIPEEDSRSIEKRDVSEEIEDDEKQNGSDSHEENEKTNTSHEGNEDVRDDGSDTNKDMGSSTEVSSTTVSVPSILRSIQSTTVGPQVYNFENLTADWWKYREQLQGVGNSDGELYPDFLQDEKIIWNKPYVSMFLGKILQFQILEYFENENTTTNIVKIQSLLHLGKSKPHMEILTDLFNITEISTKPLLEYFKPLEDFLDAGGKFQNKTSNDSNDFNLFSDSYSMESVPNDNDVQKSSNTIVFALLILAVLGIVLVTIFVTLRRYRRKQRAKERRKRLNEVLNS